LQEGERGLETWFHMFGSRLMEPLADSQHSEFFRLVSDYAAPHLLRDGNWSADYRRLRIAGRKSCEPKRPLARNNLTCETKSATRYAACSATASSPS
jgi:hypothetical protein